MSSHLGNQVHLLELLQCCYAKTSFLPPAVPPKSFGMGVDGSYSCVLVRKRAIEVSPAELPATGASLQAAVHDTHQPEGQVAASPKPRLLDCMNRGLLEGGRAFARAAAACKGKKRILHLVNAAGWLSECRGPQIVVDHSSCLFVGFSLEADSSATFAAAPLLCRVVELSALSGSGSSFTFRTRRVRSTIELLAQEPMVGVRSFQDSSGTRFCKCMPQKAEECL